MTAEEELIYLHQSKIACCFEQVKQIPVLQEIITQTE